MIEKRQFRLARKAEDVRRGGSILPGAGSQLIVPVMEPQLIVPVMESRLSDQPTSARTNAVLWLESTSEGAFSREDVDVLLALADYVGDTHAKTMRLEEHGRGGPGR